MVGSMRFGMSQCRGRCEVVLGRLDGELPEGVFEPTRDGEAGIHFVEEGAMQPTRWWNVSGVAAPPSGVRWVA